MTDDETLEQVGPRLRALRVERGATLAELAPLAWLMTPSWPGETGALLGVETAVEAGRRLRHLGTNQVAVTCGVGDYRSGDEIWCLRLLPADFGRSLNRDVLVPRPAGRFLFGRLIGREEGKLHLLPLGGGPRQIVIADPPWMAMATKLVRNL